MNLSFWGGIYGNVYFLQNNIDKFSIHGGYFKELELSLLNCRKIFIGSDDLYIKRLVTPTKLEDTSLRIDSALIGELDVSSDIDINSTVDIFNTTVHTVIIRNLIGYSGDTDPSFRGF